MIDNVEKLLSRKKFPPVLLMFGSEDFLLEESFYKILTQLNDSETAEFNYDQLSGDETDLRTVIDICTSFPFMGNRRVVALKNTEKLFKGRKSKKMEKEVAPFLEYLKNPNRTTILIMTAQIDKIDGVSKMLSNPRKKAAAEKKLSKAKYPFNEIFEKCEWMEFPKIWENELGAWTKSRVKSFGMDIAPDALELLTAQSNPSLREINNEISKLETYLDERKKITLDDVNFVVCASRKYNVFELQKAVGERSLDRSIMILQNVLSAERLEMLIISILTRFFTALWKLTEERAKGGNNYQIASAIGVNPFFVPEYFKALEQYRTNEIENAFFALAEADESLKSSSTSNIFTMQKMLLRIIRGE